jgi:translation initiation factor 1A
MPKSKGRGGKNRRRAKNTGNDVKREIEFKEEGQEYAQVLKMFGGARCEVYCFDGVKRIATIRGKLIKRVWIGADDIVLVSLRDFTKDSKKCDIIHKFYSDEAKKLKTYGEIPENIEIGADGNMETNDANIVFDDLSGEDEGDDDDVKEIDSDDEIPDQVRRYDMPSSDSEDAEEEAEIQKIAYKGYGKKEDRKVDSDDDKDSLDDI